MRGASLLPHDLRDTLEHAPPGLGPEVARRRRNRVGRHLQDKRQARHREPAHVAVMCERGEVGDSSRQAITRVLGALQARPDVKAALSDRIR